MNDKNKTTSNLDVENFDQEQLSPVVNGVVEDRTKPHLDITYNLTGKEVKDGLKRFQKNYGRTRKYIYTILCAAIVLINLFDMIFRKNLSGYTYFFVGVALAIIFIIWYNPIRHRNIIARSIDLEKMDFSMSFYDDMIYIKEENGSNRISYSSEESKMIEDDEKFIVVSNAQRIYIIPKRCLKNDETDRIREYAKKFKERNIIERTNK